VRERAQLIKAKMTLCSEPGKGTEVSVEVPTI
jgi:signal transduction histidine kinase